MERTRKKIVYLDYLQRNVFTGSIDSTAPFPQFVPAGCAHVVGFILVLFGFALYLPTDIIDAPLPVSDPHIYQNFYYDNFANRPNNPIYQQLYRERLAKEFLQEFYSQQVQPLNQLNLIAINLQGGYPYPPANCYWGIVDIYKWRSILNDLDPESSSFLKEHPRVFRSVLFRPLEMKKYL